MAEFREALSLLRRPEVQRRCGMSRSALYAAIARDEFPRAVRLGKSRSVAWNSSEIDRWVAAQIEAARKVAV